MKKGTISLMIIMISIALFCCYHIYYYYINRESDNLIRNNYYDNSNELSKVESISNEIKEKYLGVIKIPKINLEKGFYSVGSKNNNVNKNVTILKESTLPSDTGSVIYLAAHSGHGPLAYFKDLDNLVIDDMVYLTINNNHYDYIVNDIYELEKNGKITVNHNIHDNYLVLTTCAPNNKQLIVVSKLINNNL